MTKNKPRELFGWLVYDWANSAFYTTVISVLVGKYLISLAEAQLGVDAVVLNLGLFNVTTKGLFGFCIAISVFLMVAMLPVLGAVADYTNLKKSMMAAFCYTGVLACAALFFVTESYVICGILIVVSNMCFAAANVFYNAFLIDITTEDKRDRFSSYGYGAGYLGGVVMLVLNILLINNAESLGISTGLAVRISFLSAAVWWGAFAAISFWLLPEAQPRDSSGSGRKGEALPLIMAAKPLEDESTPLDVESTPLQDESTPLDDESSGASVSFPSGSAAMMSGKALPFRETDNKSGGSASTSKVNILTIGFTELGATIKELWRLKHTRRFLIAYLFYNDGIQTVILQASVFISFELFTSKNIPEDDAFLLSIFLIAQLSALVGAVLFERLARIIGAKETIIVSLVVWCAIVIYAYGFFATERQAYVMGGFIGLVLGAAQALSRSLYSQMIPRGRESSFFGLYEISEKGTSWMGQLMFTIIVGATASYRSAILGLIVFFVVGTVLLLFTDTKKAIHEAGNKTAEEAAGV